VQQFLVRLSSLGLLEDNATFNQFTFPMPARFRCCLVLTIVGLGFALPHASADERIKVEAEINDKPVTLGFDTGASAPFLIWKTVATRLGIKSSPPPADLKLEVGEVAPDRSELVKLKVFGHTFEKAELRVLDMPYSDSETEIQGVVGWPAARDGILTLKIADRLVDFSATLPDTVGWRQLAIKKEHDVLTFVLPEAGEANTDLMLVDTGWSGGLALSPERWRAWRAAHPRQIVTKQALFTPAAGLVVSEVAWAEEISLNGFVIRGVAVSEGHLQDLVGRAAIIGIAGLRRVDLIADHKNGVAYTRTRTEPPATPVHNRMGAVFVPPNERSNDLVAHVAPNSPAEKAGIRNGDILLKIDELDVTPWRTKPGILPLSRFFEQPAGKTLTLTYKRGANTKKAIVRLIDILGPSRKE
jgi:hypothetical protein